MGSTPGGNDYYQSGNLGSALTATVNGLPTDGSHVDVTLWSLVGGNWYTTSTPILLTTMPAIKV